MFHNLKIGSRLALGFGVLLALFFALSGAAFLQLQSLTENAGYYSVNLVPSYGKIHELSESFGEMRRAEFRHILSNSEKDMDEQEARMARARQKANTMLDHYAQNLVSDDTERRALEAVRSTLKDYYAAWDNQIRAVSRMTTTDPSKTAEATSLVIGASSKAFAALNGAVDKWYEYNVQLAKVQDEALASTSRNARWTLALTTLAAVAVGLCAAVLITRSIVRPLQRATEVARAVAAGDLTSHVDVQGKDETAELLGALRDMNQGLVQIVGQVRNSSDSIATGSSQIAAGNSDLSQRTEEQASNLEETAASMEQLASTVKNNADTAHHANELATSASQAAARGGEVVQQVVGTMQDISTSSRKIADIIGTIDGIAFQTNILALNAAVEAARAGEQGRGFAVVAGEVRNLASRAADAAKEIKTLIHASVERVEVGTQLVNTAGESMGEIVSQVHRVSQMINEISTASNEQTMGISQVGEAVTQLDHVTQQNAALVEESAAAAESLRHQAAQLAEVVRKFRLADDLGGGFASPAPMAHNAPLAKSVSTVKHTPSTPKAKPAPAAKATPASTHAPSAAHTPQASSAATPAVAHAGGDDWETF